MTEARRRHRRGSSPLVSTNGAGTDPARETADDSTDNIQGVRLWGPQTILSLAAAIVLLVALAFMVDLEAVWQEILKCDKSLALLGMLAHYASYPVRGIRWRRVLKHLHPKAGWGRFSLLVFFYNSVDNVVPAKLGDVYGAHLARINLGIRRSTALGAIVFVRMVDVWVVLSLAALSSWALFAERLPGSVVWALVFGAILAVAITVAILTFFLLKKSLPAWIPDAVRERIVAFQSGMWPRRREFLKVALLTVVIWGLETAWILCLAFSFGLNLSLAELLFLTMVPLLASTFPLTPSGAGVVELTLYGSLRALSVAAPTAASLTVLNRFIDYWLHIALGLVTWAMRHRLGLRTWREVPVEHPRGSEALEPSV